MIPPGQKVFIRGCQECDKFLVLTPNQDDRLTALQKCDWVIAIKIGTTILRDFWLCPECGHKLEIAKRDASRFMLLTVAKAAKMVLNGQSISTKL